MFSESGTTSSMAAASSFPSFSSSSSIHPWNHDVFLSFRGKDVRPNFVSHLHHALDKRGINTYIDDQLVRGEEISEALLNAIEGSMTSIIVFSKNYAESRWCLDELLKILECKEAIKQIVLPIFYDVDPSDVRHQKGSFGVAFDKLGDKIKDSSKVMKWKVALEKVSKFSGFVLGNRKESEFIEEIIQCVDSRMINQTTLSVAKYPVGIDLHIRHIYEHLSIGKNDIVCIVGIFGTGGIGKTTISKDIYNQISSQFEGSCLLQNVRETSEKTGGLIQLQKNLLRDILGTNLDVSDTDRGINVIKHRLRFKRVLLILDDVTELVQIDKLAGGRDWFGSGSRIIITTRDQSLLDKANVDSKHKVSLLNDNEALQLFSLHAFGEKVPLEDYVDLSKHVIQYAKGLPLALEVLGSDLKGKSIRQWKSALEKYQNIPNRNIHEVLSVSYEGLDSNEREMFLDIAFFFKGGRLDNIKEIFDSCQFFPDDGIDRLVDKCLITIEYETVRMHDLLQDMGREIVRRESPEEPGERSRLWFHKDIRKVLEEESTVKDTNKIKGMIIEMPEDEKTINLSPKAFERIKRLRVFINRNASFSSGPIYLSNELRVLNWMEYPHSSLPPNFHLNKLIIFKMHGGFIKELGTGFQFKNLATMTFETCDFLTHIPDLSSIQNLKKLHVRKCTSLVEVHDSLGSLNNLCYLYIDGCTNLRIFPRSIKLRSLLRLQLTDCSSLRYCPEIGCEMKYLRELCLDHTAVEELPLSIANLIGLKDLDLNGCKNLKRLPVNIIFQLPHLRAIWIIGHPNLVKKMGDDRQSTQDIESTTMEEEILKSKERLQELVPPVNSSNESNALQVPNLQNYFQLESNFFTISSFFTMFAFHSTLHELNLSKTKMVSLPTSIKGFVSLANLYLYWCVELEEILELPPNIKFVGVGGCRSLERFPEVSKIFEFNGSHIRSLQYINLHSSDKMREKIWNYKVPNTLLWKGHHDAAAFPENQMKLLEWLRYQTEFLENEIIKTSVINIEGPHYLENISGIVIYTLAFHGKFRPKICGYFEISSDSSNHVCRFSWEEMVELNMTAHNVADSYVVGVKHCDLKSFGLKVLDNLRVRFLIFSGRKPFRIPLPYPRIGDACGGFRSWGANVVYKHESRVHKRKRNGLNFSCGANSEYKTESRANEKGKMDVRCYRSLANRIIYGCRKSRVHKRRRKMDLNQ